MADIAWSAIHHVFNQHLAQRGLQKPNPMPQPQQNTNMHKMVLHAMAMTPNKEGETQGQMVLRALSDHLKRVTPDVSSIHKEPQEGKTGGY